MISIFFGIVLIVFSLVCIWQIYQQRKRKYTKIRLRPQKSTRVDVSSTRIVRQDFYGNKLGQFSLTFSPQQFGQKDKKVLPVFEYFPEMYSTDDISQQEYNLEYCIDKERILVRMQLNEVELRGMRRRTLLVLVGLCLFGIYLILSTLGIIPK